MFGVFLELIGSLSLKSFGAAWTETNNQLCPALAAIMLEAAGSSFVWFYCCAQCLTRFHSVDLPVKFDS